ncbi:MAG: helix-turn-helix domain-containing protein [Chloroflexi bacterium]|nr:helix-turn-helix domain-containing protein [Chloroflexota bacterium]MBI5714740.1 helix-turn-helix domain-containing protein [Chloroflexota bacterium]
MPTEDWITSEEAIRISGFHQDYLRRILRAGKIISRKWGREWQISKSSLLTYLREGRKSSDKRRGAKEK